YLSSPLVSSFSLSDVALPLLHSFPTRRSSDLALGEFPLFFNVSCSSKVDIFKFVGHNVAFRCQFFYCFHIIICCNNLFISNLGCRTVIGRIQYNHSVPHILCVYCHHSSQLSAANNPDLLWW